MTKVYAPNAKFSGRRHGVLFDEGVADTTDKVALERFGREGYGIGRKPGEAEATAPAVDARSITSPEPVGTTLRDAAVDPLPSDFLPPTNAGKADPHGPLVVAPGIHAVGPTPIAPGPVSTVEAAVEANPSVRSQGVPSLEEQQHRADVQEGTQTALASQVLVEGQPATIVAADEDASRGPLGISDPASVEAGTEAAALVAAQAPDAADAGRNTPVAGATAPKGNAPQAAWVDYAVASGAKREDVEDLKRDELIERFGPKG